MVVLIRDIIYIFRNGECSRQIRSGSRFIGIQRDIVQSHRSVTRDILDSHLVRCLQVMNCLHTHRLTHLFITAVCHDVDGIQRDIIQTDGHLCGIVRRHHRCHLSFRAYSFCRNSEGMASACSYRRRIIQVTASMIPGEVINLIQGIIVVCQGIILFLEFRFTHRQRSTIIFRQEVIAVVRIRITDAFVVGIPSDWSDGVEQFSTSDLTRRNFRQIIGLCQIIGRQCLGLQSTTITIDFDLIDIREASLSNQITGYLIDTRRRYTDFCPFARCQHGMVSIALRRSPSSSSL